MDERISDLMNFEEWLRKRGLSEGSVVKYMAAVTKFILTDPKIDTVDSYNEFIFTYGIQRRSAYYYDALKLFVKWKFAQDPRGQSISRNLLKAKPKDPKKAIHYLDDDSREQVINLMTDYKYRVIARIQNITGVRAGDVLRLKRGTIMYEAYNDQQVVMRIDFEGKGGKHFTKWIFDEYVQTQIDLYLKSNIVDSEYYFIEHTDSRPVYHSIINEYNTYRKCLKEALHTCGFDLKDWSTHDFRRAFARNVWNLTKDPVLLKEMMNHSQFETTLRYLRGSGLQSKDVYYQLSQKDQKPQLPR